MTAYICRRFIRTTAFIVVFAAVDETTKLLSTAEAGLINDDVNVVTASSPSAYAAEWARDSFSDKKIRLAFIRKVGAKTWLMQYTVYTTMQFKTFCVVLLCIHTVG